MEHIKQIYKIKNVDTKDLLFKFDFHRYGKDGYVHRFPVYKYKGKTLVYSEFVIYDDSEVEEDNNILHVNVYDSNGHFYPYNEVEYGNSDVVKCINNNIQNEIEKFTEEGLILVE